MTDKECKAATKDFAEFWQDKGYEKGESQAFIGKLIKSL